MVLYKSYVDGAVDFALLTIGIKKGVNKIEQTFPPWIRSSTKDIYTTLEKQQRPSLQCLFRRRVKTAQKLLKLTLQGRLVRFKYNKLIFLYEYSVTCLIIT